MPRPLAICIEDLDASAPEQRYLQCVALVGRQPGLRLDAAGEVSWLEEPGGAPAAELWVSLDERLILFRPQGAAPLVVAREGRSLQVPFGKPVVLVDGDRIDVGARRLRVHVHGDAPAVAEPTPYIVPVEAAPDTTDSGSRLVRAAATALTIGAVVGGAGCKGCPIDVRDKPPEPPVDPNWKQQQAPPPKQAAPDAAPKPADAAPVAPADAAPPKPDLRRQSLKKKGTGVGSIEVRMKPPGASAFPSKAVRPSKKKRP